MVRHFENKPAAKRYLKTLSSWDRNQVKIFRKVKGQKNRGKKPIVVCSYLEWLNLY